jgi:hypothetical protein
VGAERIVDKTEQFYARHAGTRDDMHGRRGNRRLAIWEHFDRQEISCRAGCPSWFKCRPLQPESMRRSEDRTGMLGDRHLHVVFQHMTRHISWVDCAHGSTGLGQQATAIDRCIFIYPWKCMERAKLKTDKLFNKIKDRSRAIVCQFVPKCDTITKNRQMSV